MLSFFFAEFYSLFLSFFDLEKRKNNLKIYFKNVSKKGLYVKFVAARYEYLMILCSFLPIILAQIIFLLYKFKYVSMLFINSYWHTIC